MRRTSDTAAASGRTLDIKACLPARGTPPTHCIANRSGPRATMRSSTVATHGTPSGD
jgi:hypothetical protein